MKILAVRPLADSAVTIELSDRIGSEASALVAAALETISGAIGQGAMPGAREAAGAFCSLTVHYDCLETSQAELLARIASLLAPLEPDARPTGRVWRLPCCYDAGAGIDLDALSERLGLPVAGIVERHAATRFTVYALGFLPGLPFMGELPPALALPRRPEPRTAVPAGSVAIANRMGVIYPWSSPGGWHIVGCCPVPLFDIGRPVPSLLAVGDRVEFEPVSRRQFEALRRQAESGALDAASFGTG